MIPKQSVKIGENMKMYLLLSLGIFFLLNQKSIAQTIQSPLGRPEIFFVITDNETAFYRIIADTYGQEPIFDRTLYLTQNYKHAEDTTTFLVGQPLNQNIGFDHVIDTDAGSQHEVVGYGNYSIKIYRKGILSWQYKFNIRHYRSSFQDIYFQIHSNATSGVYEIGYGFSAGLL